MRSATVAEMKGKGVSGVKHRKDKPIEGTITREIYDRLCEGQEVFIKFKDKSKLIALRDYYGVETRCVGGGKYVRCG
jgi:hypothetical protein